MGFQRQIQQENVDLLSLDLWEHRCCCCCCGPHSLFSCCCCLCIFAVHKCCSAVVLLQVCSADDTSRFSGLVSLLPSFFADTPVENIDTFPHHQGAAVPPQFRAHSGPHLSLLSFLLICRKVWAHQIDAGFHHVVET